MYEYMNVMYKMYAMIAVFVYARIYGYMVHVMGMIDMNSIMCTYVWIIYVYVMASVPIGKVLVIWYTND